MFLKKLYLFAFISLFLLQSNLYAQKLEIRGSYHKKNLYIENPFNAKRNEFCIDSIVIWKGKHIRNPHAMALEIDLSEIRENDTVVGTVYYKSWAKPKIINPHAIWHPSRFINAYSHRCIDINGVYYGKKLFVENPYVSEYDAFCVEEVYLNGRLITKDIESSAFEINAGNHNVLQGQDVHIQIVHHERCKPKVLNPQAVRVANHFHFLDLKVTETFIEWQVENEHAHGTYYVEQFLHEGWIVVNEVEMKKQNAVNKYGIMSEHLNGKNTYRIRYHDSAGEEYYSNSITFTSNAYPVSFQYIPSKQAIQFTKSTPFEIWDMDGNFMLKGKSQKVDISTFPRGVYYIYYDNKSDKFFK